MNYISIPNIPKKGVKLAVVDGRISPGLKTGLLGRGIELITTQAHPVLYPAISFHPDIIFFHLGDRKLIYAPDTSENVITKLKDKGFELIKGETVLTRKYPGNICYNAARVGNIVFHNTKYTDRIIKENLYNIDVELVHVNQGYAKCAISVVDENSIITMDKGIAKVAERKGLDVLVVEEDGILLTGIGCGFIGGSTCLIDEKKWGITGDIGGLKSASKIYDFLSEKEIEIVCLSKEQVTDIGSIIPLITE